VDVGPCSRDRALVRLLGEFGMSQAPPVVGVVSRLTRLKGLEAFLEAAAIVATRFPAARFLVVGETSPDDRAYRTELTTLARQLGGAGKDPIPLRLRVGTRLWLGDPGSLTTVATVLDVHPVRRGDRAGYRQRRIARSGWLVIMAGGTAHGIGMEAPTSASSNRQRVVALAQGGLQATGRALSPYTIAGSKRWFLEPPHMQASLVLLPDSVPPPTIGDDLPVELRLTTALVDRIVEV